MSRSSVTLSLVPEARGGPFVFWGSVSAALRDAAKLGFDAIEIFPPGPDAVTQADFAKQISDSGLGVAAVGTGAGWVVHRLSLSDASESKRNAAIDFIRRILDAAAPWGAPAIIGSMQGRSSQDVPPDRARGFLREALEVLDRHASLYQGRVLYEPLNRYETDLCNGLESGMAMIDGLSHTQLLADWFHMNIEESDMAHAIRLAGRAIGHIHFADTNRKAVGMGHLDVAPLMEALRSIGFSGYLSAEVFAVPDSLTAAKTTIESFRKWTGLPPEIPPAS